MPCPDFWHHVYQNNYCNSVYGTLLNIRVCGMIVTNKGLPISVKENIQRIKKGGKSFYCKVDVMLHVRKKKRGGEGREQRITSPLPDTMTLKSEATYMVRENQLMKHECNLEYNKHKQVWVE